MKLFVTQIGVVVDDDRSSPLPPDTPSELNVFGHDGNTLGMNCTQVGVLKQSHKICFCCLLQCQHRVTLETQIRLQISQKKKNRCTVTTTSKGINYKIYILEINNIISFE